MRYFIKITSPKHYHVVLSYLKTVGYIKFPRLRRLNGSETIVIGNESNGLNSKHVYFTRDTLTVTPHRYSLLIIPKNQFLNNFK